MRKYLFIFWDEVFLTSFCLSVCLFVCLSITQRETQLDFPLFLCLVVDFFSSSLWSLFSFFSSFFFQKQNSHGRARKYCVIIDGRWGTCYYFILWASLLSHHSSKLELVIHSFVTICVERSCALIFLILINNRRKKIE
jgi:hypothetical protein